MSIARPAKTMDIPTLLAISVITWASVDILHEIVGHAGAALLMGYPVKAVSTTTAYVDIDWKRVIASQGMSAIRLFLAGGTLMNVLSGGLALLALWRWKTAGSAARCFLWLFANFSMVIIFMNLVANPLLGFGDFNDFTYQLEPRGLFKAILVGAGLVLCVLGYVWALKLWLPRLKEQRRLQLGFTVLPVLVLIVVQTLSLIGSPFSRLPPESNHMLASVFAYLHFVLWVVVVNLIPVPRSIGPVENIRLPRADTWLAAGLVVFVLFVFVLGPGIGSFAGHPSLKK